MPLIPTVGRGALFLLVYPGRPHAHDIPRLVSLPQPDPGSGMREGASEI